MILCSKVVNGTDDHTDDQKINSVGNHRQRDEIEMSLKGTERQRRMPSGDCMNISLVERMSSPRETPMRNNERKTPPEGKNTEKKISLALKSAQTVFSAQVIHFAVTKYRIQQHLIFKSTQAPPILPSRTGKVSKSSGNQ